MSETKGSFSTSGRSRRGEPLVWLTAAGLAIGVVLTLCLLGLVAYKGLQVFWANDLVEMEVEIAGERTMMAGYIVQERERRDMQGKYHEELQLFRGNPELYGEKFIYFDRSAIVAQAKPDDLLLVERLEGGNAIGRVTRLVKPDGTVVDGDSPELMDAIDEVIAAAEDLRQRLRQIEKREIGANSRRVAELRQQIRNDRDAAAAETELAALQAEFEELDKRRTELREQMDDGSLVIAAADGRELEIPAGELLHVFAPNTAGFLTKVGEAFRRVWVFLSDDPREANMEGGVYPALFGTVVMTLVMSLFVTPFGVIAAIYLREYAKQGLLVRAVRISVNNLAGVPSIVFGVFGLAFFVYFVGGVVDQTFYSEKLPSPTFKSGGILWASLTLALLTVPVVIVATEEALAAVPRGVREAALAGGASKWQTIQRVVLPASIPGILTGVILAMARGAGEVAPLMIVGVVKSAPDLPIDTTAPFIHAERQFMHLGFHIYDLGFQSPDSEAAKPMVFATALLLITIVVVMNLGAIILRNRLRRKYATSSF